MTGNFAKGWTQIYHLFQFGTLNERYAEEAHPSFDGRPELGDEDDAHNHLLYLHMLQLNQCEDSSIFVVGRTPGRAYPPAYYLLFFSH